MKKLDEAIERFRHNAEYERTHGNLQGCLDFRQLAEWLAELKKLKGQQEPYEDAIIDEHYWKGFNNGIRTEKFRESKRQEIILDKVRAEIDRQEKWLLQAGYTAYNIDIAFDVIKSVVAESEDKK